MAYDPFQRGPFAVGVRTSELIDPERGRSLAIETWYPADAANAGADLARDTKDRYQLLAGLPHVAQDAVRDARPAAGRFPVVAFSHGFGGHRRQSTFLCTHFASHGYVVAAVDHTGNTTIDILEMTRASRGGARISDPLSTLETFVHARPLDVRFMIDRLLDGMAGQVAAIVDAERIGMSGHSFGGWTTLAATRADLRIRAALPLAPAGGATRLTEDILHSSLDFSWGREVPTLFLVAERDSLLPLAGMHDLLARTPSAAKRMVVLENADHMHFCDNPGQAHEMFRMMPPPGLFTEIAKMTPPMRELCPGDHAHDMVRGLGLAHMDATLKGHDRATGFLQHEAARALAARGIRVAMH